MSNIVSTIIFCGRNFDKTDNGDIGRAPVAVGQFRNVVNGVTAYDNAIGKTAKTAVNAFDKVAKADKLVDYAGKGVRFLSKNINPLICVSSGIQILNSDDKERTAMVQATDRKSTRLNSSHQII